MKVTKRSFRILNDWHIVLKKPTKKLQACMAALRKRKDGVIYGWPGKDEPKDFLVHEYLHFALRALATTDKRSWKEYLFKEEQLVEDICRILNSSSGGSGRKSTS